MAAYVCPLDLLSLLALAAQRQRQVDPPLPLSFSPPTAHPPRTTL